MLLEDPSILKGDETVQLGIKYEGSIFPLCYLNKSIINDQNREATK